MSALGRALLAALDADDLAELRHLLGLDHPPVEAPAAVTSEALLSPAAAAERVGVHVETIRRACRSGALPAFHVGHCWRVRPADLSEWLAGEPREVHENAPRRGPRSPRRANATPMADALARLDSWPQ